MTLARYQCHKVVEAGKILKIAYAPSIALTVEVGSSLSHAAVSPAQVVLAVPPAYLRKHQPEVGGYYVRYEDGYESYSPAAAFESGYSLYEEPI